MKRFWLVLLSLGLIVAFSTSAMAVDVKFNGEYYAAGMYLDKTSLKKDAGPSTAFYFQRLRLGTQFVVSPGLTLVTRADIMERAWGAQRTWPAGGAGSLDTLSAGTRAENENIAFDLAYVNYVSPIGLFQAGYVIDGAWGTVFGDNSMPSGRIMYLLAKGPIQFAVMGGKLSQSVTPAGVVNGENSRGNFGNGLGDSVDKDNDFYTAFVKYFGKNFEAGFLEKYVRIAANRNLLGALVPDTGYTTNAYVSILYGKAKFGVVSVQAEVNYAFGDASDWEGRPDLIPAVLGGPQVDQDLESMSAFLDATADFGKFYIGGTLAYVSGDDPATNDKREGGVIDGGLDYNPCLIMFNSDLNYWAGAVNGYGGTATGSPMTNAWFGQIRGGVRPIDKLDIMLSFSYAKADKSLGVGFDEREYGSEIDLTATYKITNNLSYMLGGAYWMVGDYYKGNTTTNNDLEDQFMVINKLTLTF